jgi:hypothetical protein
MLVVVPLIHLKMENFSFFETFLPYNYDCDTHNTIRTSRCCWIMAAAIANPAAAMTGVTKRRDDEEEEDEDALVTTVLRTDVDER